MQADTHILRIPVGKPFEGTFLKEYDADLREDLIDTIRRAGKYLTMYYTNGESSLKNILVITCEAYGEMAAVSCSRTVRTWSVDFALSLLGIFNVSAFSVGLCQAQCSHNRRTDFS